MPEQSDQIFVKSHVARDLLQSAAIFKTERLVVQEYVSNGLDSQDIGKKPIVHVELDSKNKRITIRDNGRGMDWEGLKNYFIMHGENIDRKMGLTPRGRHGTGKSAVFGIADKLRISTVRNKKISIVELHRNDIANMGSEDGIPVKTIEKEGKTDSQNGTIVEIGNIHLRSLDQASIRRYIERHLIRWPPQ